MPIFDTPKIKDHKELYIFLRRTAANPYKISMIQALGSAKRNYDKTWVRDDAALNSNLIAGAPWLSLDRERERHGLQRDYTSYQKTQGADEP